MPDVVRSDRWIALMLMACSLAVLAMLLVLGVRLTDEDGYYYLKIAQQVALGHGSTFDGVHVTNGYHPLWLLCLVPIFWLTSTPEAALLLSTIVQGMLAAATVGVLYATARLAYRQLAAIVASLLWILLTYQISLSGLEYSVHALCLLATAYVYLRWFCMRTRPRQRIYLVLGLLLSLTFLARIETIGLAGLIGLFLLGRAFRRGYDLVEVSSLLAFGAPLMLTVLGYIGYNLWLVGHPLPVSGALKRAWSIELLAHDPRYLAGGWLAAKVAQLADPITHFYGIYVISIGVGTVGAALFGQPIWRPFVLYSLLQFAAYICLYDSSFSFAQWYYVVQHFLTVLLLASLVDWVVGYPRFGLRRGSEIARSRYLGMLLAGVAIGGGALSIAWSVGQWSLRERTGVYQYPLIDAARWARANLPPDAIVGVWNAGTIGYLAQRRVINLDGLVNSWTYFQAERFDLCTYWRKNQVTYLLDAFEQRQALSVVPTYATYASCADQLELIWSDQRQGTTWRMEAYHIRPAGP
ncbi:MAG: hypothetical protein ACJ8CR_17575 [Roseiflexaceae bacterium]